MTEQQALPPVGELVQITEGVDYGASVYVPLLARFDGKYLITAEGHRVHPSWVTSWQRVIVVPDTDETREVVHEALQTHAAELFMETDTFQGCCTDAVLAALREAAIR